MMQPTMEHARPYEIYSLESRRHQLPTDSVWKTDSGMEYIIFTSDIHHKEIDIRHFNIAKSIWSFTLFSHLD